MSRLARIAALRVPYVQGVTHGVRVMTEAQKAPLECSVCDMPFFPAVGLTAADFTIDERVFCSFCAQHEGAA